jgi:hypothetical protein
MTTMLDTSADTASPSDEDWVPAHEPTDAMLVAESLGRLFVNRPISPEPPSRVRRNAGSSRGGDRRGVRRVAVVRARCRP